MRAPLISPRTSAAVRAPRDQFLSLTFVAALAAAVLVLHATVSQPILESYGFRQAQTALTAYWFMREGFALAYQTPVLGYPWAIPFELPLFQALVAGLASMTNYSLEGIGRALSFAFFLATLLPVAVICRELKLGHRVFLVFGSLYLLSPQYLFWGRTFMIESAATFFSVATIAAALPLLTRPAVSHLRMIAVVLLGSMAATVKVTTALPMLAVLSAIGGLIALSHWRGDDTRRALAVAGRLLLFALPVLAALVWTHFTDAVKAENELGKLIDSKALSEWHFGSMRQRFSRAFLVDVIWKRSFVANAGGVLGLAAIGFFFIREKHTTLLSIAGCLVALFLLPPLIFTNLHIVHTYYQSANIIYLIFLLAIALVASAERTSARFFVVVFALILLSGGFRFFSEPWRLARKPITPENNVLLAAAQVTREQSPREWPVLVYGLDWSSELPFYAERKALAVPDWYKSYNEPLTTPERYFGGNRVGALVICGPAKGPSEDAVQHFLKRHGPFRDLSTDACRIFIA